MSISKYNAKDAYAFIQKNGLKNYDIGLTGSKKILIKDKKLPLDKVKKYDKDNFNAKSFKEAALLVIEQAKKDKPGDARDVFKKIYKSSRTFDSKTTDVAKKVKQSANRALEEMKAQQSRNAPSKPSSTQSSTKPQPAAKPTSPASAAGQKRAPQTSAAPAPAQPQKAQQEKKTPSTPPKRENLSENKPSQNKAPLDAEKKKRQEDAEYKKCLDFYKQGKKNSHGKTLDDILAWKGDSEKLENGHNYIQWLFPLASEGQDKEAPLLNQKIEEEFKKDPQLQAKVLKSYKMMLKFYGLKLKGGVVKTARKSIIPKWIKPNAKGSPNHNLKRISRMLASMRHLGLQKNSLALCKWAEQNLYNSKSPIKMDSKQKAQIKSAYETHWYPAAYGKPFPGKGSSTKQAPTGQESAPPSNNRAPVEGPSSSSGPTEQTSTQQASLVTRFKALQALQNPVLFEDHVDSLSWFLSNYYPCPVSWTSNSSGNSYQFIDAQTAHLGFMFLVAGREDVTHMLSNAKSSDEVRQIFTAHYNPQSLDLTRWVSQTSQGVTLEVLAMQKCLLAKFSQNEELKLLLLATGSLPITKLANDENDQAELYWGVGKTVQGQNVLGWCLEQLRAELRQQHPSLVADFLRSAAAEESSRLASPPQGKEKGKEKVEEKDKKSRRASFKVPPRKTLSKESGKSSGRDNSISRQLNELQKRARAGAIQFYTGLDSVTGFLANTYHCNVILNGAQGKTYTFTNVDAAYQGYKFYFFNQVAVTEEISKAKYMDEVNEIVKKNEGLVLKTWHGQNDQGVDQKFVAMQQCIYQKFKYNPELKQLLLATGQAQLINQLPKNSENRDRYWCVDANRKGRNQLGIALMNVRTMLQHEEAQAAPSATQQNPPSSSASPAAPTTTTSSSAGAGSQGRAGSSKPSTDLERRKVDVRNKLQWFKDIETGEITSNTYVEAVSDDISGPLGFLSNFYPSKIKIEAGQHLSKDDSVKTFRKKYGHSKLTFSTAFAAISFYKFHFTENYEIAKKLIKAKNGSEALEIVKKNAKLINDYDLKNDNKGVRVQEKDVCYVLKCKFDQNSELAALLLETAYNPNKNDGDYDNENLIIVTPSQGRTDAYWTAGIDGNGSNRLGKMLEQVRAAMVFKLPKKGEEQEGT